MNKLNPGCNKIGFSGALCLPSKVGATGFMWVGMWEDQLHNRSVVTCGLQHCWGIWTLDLCRGRAATPCQTQASSFSRAWREGHSGKSSAHHFLCWIGEGESSKGSSSVWEFVYSFSLFIETCQKTSSKISHPLDRSYIKSIGPRYTFINIL